MLTKEQAFEIIKNIVPDIELRGVRITDKPLNDNNKNSLNDCWFITYSTSRYHLACNANKTISLCIHKMTGEIISQ